MDDRANPEHAGEILQPATPESGVKAQKPYYSLTPPAQIAAQISAVPPEWGEEVSSAAPMVIDCAIPLLNLELARHPGALIATGIDNLRRRLGTEDHSTRIRVHEGALLIRLEATSKQPLTDKQLAARLEALIGMRDIEDAHGQADDLLVETLRALGYKRAMAMYERVEKWYA